MAKVTPNGFRNLVLWIMSGLGTIVGTGAFAWQYAQDEAIDATKAQVATQAVTLGGVEKDIGYVRERVDEILEQLKEQRKGG